MEDLELTTGLIFSKPFYRHCNCSNAVQYSPLWKEDNPVQYYCSILITILSIDSNAKLNKKLFSLLIVRGAFLSSSLSFDQDITTRESGLLSLIKATTRFYFHVNLRSCFFWQWCPYVQWELLFFSATMESNQNIYHLPCLHFSTIRLKILLYDGSSKKIYS